MSVARSPPPSPLAEKASACEEQTGKASAAGDNDTMTVERIFQGAPIAVASLYGPTEEATHLIRTGAWVHHSDQRGLAVF